MQSQKYLSGSKSSKKKSIGPKMSDDKGSAAPVNVVKPTSNRSSASQGLKDDNPTISTNWTFLPPDTPPTLFAALSKKIKPTDQFTEPFGTVNKYGETILFELPVQVSFMTPSRYPQSSQIDRVSNGKVAIIFYSEQGKVVLVVTRNDSFWPVVNKEFLKNTSGRFEEKFITRGCTAEPATGSPVAGCQIFSIKKTDKAGCYLVGVMDGVYVSFCNEIDHNRFKNAIRNAQSRISKNLLPTNDIPKKGGVSEFWYQSVLRPCDFKLLFLHKTRIWEHWMCHEQGFVAIGQNKADKSLQLIILSKSIKNHCKVSDDFTLIASDIKLDTYNFVWEWYVDLNEINACGFKTDKEATDFKTIMDYYLDAWKKKSLSWDW